MGTSIGKEVRKRRIDVAKQLLLETDMPIQTVATEAGFSSSERLATVFREAAGMTPTAYRTYCTEARTNKDDLDLTSRVAK
jgi:AraC-like DNA-binding protein